MKREWSAVAAFVGLLAGAGAAHAQHGGGHHCEPEPIMQRGDFNGDGVISPADLAMLNAYKDAGDYAAFFDMNADGKLNGRDVAAVATHMGSAGTARDTEMAQLWATIEPYRNIQNAMLAGYAPITPDAKGHGIHFSNANLVFSWPQRGFVPGQPEGLNYSASGELLAAFYFAPAAVDLHAFGAWPEAGVAYQAVPAPASFTGVSAHAWHNHVGVCLGPALSCPVAGFDQCTTQAQCDDMEGERWWPKFHMLHVWMIEFNECGPFGLVDHDVSHHAPEEPNHGACNLQDVVPLVVNEPGVEPTGFERDACYN